MFDSYHCQFCDLRLTADSGHGNSKIKWSFSNYCRKCGESYGLNLVKADDDEPEHLKLRDMECLVATYEPVEDLSVHRVTCSYCDATGPLGNNGPLTNAPPEGFTDHFGKFGRCPRCMEMRLIRTGRGTH